MACFKITTNAKNGACFAINTVLGEGCFSISIDETVIEHTEIIGVSEIYDLMDRSGSSMYLFCRYFGAICIVEVSYFFDAYGDLFFQGDVIRYLNVESYVGVSYLSYSLSAFDTTSTTSNIALYSIFNSKVIYISQQFLQVISVISSAFEVSDPFYTSHSEVVYQDNASGTIEYNFSENIIDETVNNEYKLGYELFYNCASPYRSSYQVVNDTAKAYIDVIANTWEDMFTDGSLTLQSVDMCDPEMMPATYFKRTKIDSNLVNSAQYYKPTQGVYSIVSGSKIRDDLFYSYTQTNDIKENIGDILIDWDQFYNFEYFFDKVNPIEGIIMPDDTQSFVGMAYRPNKWFSKTLFIIGDYKTSIPFDQTEQRRVWGDATLLDETDYYPVVDAPQSSLQVQRLSEYKYGWKVQDGSGLKFINVDEDENAHRVQITADWYAFGTNAVSASGDYKVSLPSFGTFQKSAAIIGGKAVVPIESPTADANGFVKLIDSSFDMEENMVNSGVVII